MKGKNKSSLLMKSIMVIAAVRLSYLWIYAQGGTGRKTGNGNDNKSGTSTNKSRSASSQTNKKNRTTSTASPESPSLNETLKFITDTVEAHPIPEMSGIREEFSISQLTGCKVKIKYNTHITEDSFIFNSFSLTDMNPQNMKIDEPNPGMYRVSMFTTGSERKIKYEDRNGSTEISQTVLVVNDKESATSVLNAFSHAIKLCGGRPDPF